MWREVRSVAVALIIGCIAPPAQARQNPSLVPSWQQIREVPNNLVLRLKNAGSSAICVPDIDAKENISFTQFGKAVEPFYYHNRAILQWRGADLISGLIVVPPGRAVDVFYDLNEWMLKRGKATATINIPEYNCLEFFRNRSPRPARQTSHFSFNAPLSVEPKN